MKKKLILLLFIPFAVFAQDNSKDSLHQEIIMSVLQQINEYESASSFANEDRITQFENLFVDLNTKVVNDIPAIGNYDEKISVEDYVSKMRKYYVKIGVDIKIHEISAINFEADNKGSLSVFLTKEVYGENAKHKIEVSEMYEGKMTTFEEYVEYEDEFDLELKFIFNNKSVKISEIVLTKNKGKLLVIAPHWKTTMKKDLTPIDEMKIEIDGAEKYLSGYYYSIPDLFEDRKITISSNDQTYIGRKTISLKTYENTDAAHLFKIPFLKTIGDLGGFGLLHLNPITVNSNNYSASVSNLSQNSFGGSISLNITKMLLKSRESRKKIPGSLFIKVGVIKENFDYELKIPTYSTTYSDIDSDGGNYERTVLLQDFNENQIIDMQTISGQAEYRWMSKKIGYLSGGISASVGFGQVTINSATYSNTASATYSGYYEDLFGITIAENGVYNFGQFNLSQSGDLDYTNVQTLLANVSGLIKMGDRVFIDIGIMYTKYQSNIFNLGTDRISYEANEFNPSVEDELNTINNLIDVDMSHISLKVGVSYKF